LDLERDRAQFFPLIPLNLHPHKLPLFFWLPPRAFSRKSRNFFLFQARRSTPHFYQNCHCYYYYYLFFPLSLLFYSRRFFFSDFSEDCYCSQQSRWEEIYPLFQFFSLVLWRYGTSHAIIGLFHHTFFVKK
jgi:hypothetical protein